MKDENGIEIYCKNCNDDVAINCPHYNPDNPDEDFGCVVSGGFVPSYDALFARIAELQNSLDETEKKLTETVKLLGERSRECGELEALLEIKNKSNMSTQSTDAADVSKKIREMDMRNSILKLRTHKEIISSYEYQNR